jgi:hypothetical protein
VPAQSRSQRLHFRGMLGAPSYKTDFCDGLRRARPDTAYGHESPCWRLRLGQAISCASGRRAGRWNCGVGFAQLLKATVVLTAIPITENMSCTTRLRTTKPKPDRQRILDVEGATILNRQDFEGLNGCYTLERQNRSCIFGRAF